MLDLVFLVILIGIATGLGRRVVARLGGEPDHPLDAFALAAPVGLGLMGLGVLALGGVGILGRASIAGGLAVAAGLGGFGGPRLLARLAREGLMGPRRPGFVGLAMGLGVVGTLLTALAPVTDGDALCYHLQVPKVFLQEGRVSFAPDLHETIYPLLTEMLYAVALALRGPVACRLVQWSLGLIFAANVAALARPMLRERSGWAASLALLTPAISNGMGAPLNDVALAAFGNAALHAWLCWRAGPTARSAALAGLLAGITMGVKYPGLVWGAMLGLAMVAVLIDRWKTEPGRRLALGEVASFSLVALLSGGVWYGRAWLATGNPVFPFFRHTFGGAGLDEVLDPGSLPMAVNPWNVVTALGSMTLAPDRFDSLAHQFGPAFLLFLPGLAVLCPPRRILEVVALGWVFLTACVCVRQSMRFVLIATGPMAVGVAWAASAWRDRSTPPARLLFGLFLAVLGVEAALAPVRARHGLSVVLGRESAEAYLTRREPTYRVGRWIDTHLPAEARLIGQEHRGFYLPRPYTMELAHRRRTGLGKSGETAEELVQILRVRGFTHLLLCPPEPETAVEFDPTLSRKLAPWLGSQEPLYQEAITDPDGVTRRYTIYGLSEASILASGANR